MNETQKRLGKLWQCLETFKKVWTASKRLRKLHKYWESFEIIRKVLSIPSNLHQILSTKDNLLEELNVYFQIILNLQIPPLSIPHLKTATSSRITSSSNSLSFSHLFFFAFSLLSVTSFPRRKLFLHQ
jgi:hypothetical protein